MGIIQDHRGRTQETALYVQRTTASLILAEVSMKDRVVDQEK